MAVMMCGWFMVVSVAAVGCADTSDQTGASIEESEVPGLTQRVSFGRVEMDLPENWGVYSNSRPAVHSTRRPSG